MKNKKGQTGGLIIGLVLGVASLIIGIIIAFIIVSTLTGADLFKETRGAITVVNEHGWLLVNTTNTTGYTLTNYDAGTTNNFVITALTNTTHDFLVGGSTGNYTLVSGVIKNATANFAVANISIGYTFDKDSAEEYSTDKISANFTAGVDNVSGKIPTVLLIAAIVLILSVLAILVGVWQRMNIGSGSTL